MGPKSTIQFRCEATAHGSFVGTSFRGDGQTLLRRLPLSSCLQSTASHSWLFTPRVAVVARDRRCRRVEHVAEWHPGSAQDQQALMPSRWRQTALIPLISPHLPNDRPPMMMGRRPREVVVVIVVVVVVATTAAAIVLQRPKAVGDSPSLSSRRITLLILVVVLPPHIPVAGAPGACIAPPVGTPRTFL